MVVNSWNAKLSLQPACEPLFVNGLQSVLSGKFMRIYQSTDRLKKETERSC